MYSPQEIALNYANVAKAKTSQKWYKALILAVLAGAYIGFGAIVATVTSAGLSSPVSNIVKAAVFPVGLILVVVCGAELFTGNCLLLSPAIGKDIKWTKLLKSWGIVYGGNLIGGVLLAVLVVYSGVLGGEDSAVRAACVATAAAKSNMLFYEAFLRGIACNMLVCLAVWATMASKSIGGKILALYFPIFCFVACGFEHSVANMYYLTAGLLAGSAEGMNVGTAILNCLLPSTLGNILGGALIACAYHLAYRFIPKAKAKQSDEAPANVDNGEEATETEEK